MTEPLWEQAARCYESAGAPAEAARCYLEASAYRRAGDLYRQLGRYAEAAEAYAPISAVDAAWLLAHHVGDSARARALLPNPHDPLEWLVLARCDIVDGSTMDNVLDALEMARAAIGLQIGDQQRIEAWAIQVAESARRYDQVALIFAACVLAGRQGAEGRWRDWAATHLGGAPIVLPEPAEAR